MFYVRKWIGLAALATLGGLIVTSSPSGPGGDDRLLAAMWLLLGPLAVTMAGLWQQAFWSRWLALAAGLAVLPWAVALAAAPPFGSPVLPRLLLLSASVALMFALTGRSMFRQYEGRTLGTLWSGPRMALVRWTIICNVASILALYLFVTAYDYHIAWHFALLASLMVGLLIGVLLLAQGRTVGILLVAACSFCFLPVGSHFVLQEASYPAEVLLFGAIFLPGIATACASLAAFGRPIWRFLVNA